MKLYHHYYFLFFSQDLTQEIGVVGLKKLDGDRNVENYDFRAAQAMRRMQEEELGEVTEELEDGEMRDDPNEMSAEMATRYLLLLFTKYILVAFYFFYNFM